jgi:ferredoxin
VEEDFIKSLFVQGETHLGRVFVHESVLTNDQALHVLDYERVSEVIAKASHRGIGLCYCRHKMEHVGRACDAPQDISMTFNNTATSLIKHGFARGVEVAKGLDFLQQAYARDLVQFGENVQKRVSFIYNCCGCCCEAMIAARRFGFLHPVHTTNFLPEIDAATCAACDDCATACPVEGSDDSCFRQQSRSSQKEKSQGRQGIVSWLCGLCPRLQDQKPPPEIQARPGDHAAQFHP